MRSSCLDTEGTFGAVSRWAGCPALVIGLLAFSNVALGDVTLKVFVEQNDGTPIVTDEVSGGVLSGQGVSGGATKFVVVVTDQLFEPILIKLEPSPPVAEFSPVRVEASPFLKNTVVVKLAATKATGSAKDVIDLWSTDVNRIANRDDLPVLYQRARVIALNRIKTLNGEWSALHDYDVEAAFKFLEVVRELNARFILASSDLSAVRDWLEKALKMKPLRVSQAVGSTASVRQLLDQVDSMDADRLAVLWRAAINPPNAVIPCDGQLPRLKAYLTLFDGKDDATRGALLQNGHIERGTIVAGIARCEMVHAKCNGRAERSEIEKHLKDVKAMVEEELRHAEDSTTLQNLKTSNATLDRVIKELVSGGALLCLPEDAAMR
jgi:hypothetical protein